MEREEKQQLTSVLLPVLPRLDRLDSLLQLLEEQHSLSEKDYPKPIIRNMETEDQCKTLSNALDEVHRKGTLMERLEMLEIRVLQLSLEIDKQNTSKSSSSSTVNEASDKFGNSSVFSSVTKEDQDVTSSTLEGKQDPLLVKQQTSAQTPATIPENQHKSRKLKTKASRSKKWSRCFSG